MKAVGEELGEKIFLSDGKDNHPDGGGAGIQNLTGTESEVQGDHFNGKRKNLFL